MELSNEQIGRIIVGAWPYAATGLSALASILVGYAVKLIKKSIKDFKQWRADADKRLKSMDDIRKDLKDVAKAMENLAGAVKHQQTIVNDYVEKMGKVSGQLEAVFRFIDAPARTTDLNGK